MTAVSRIPTPEALGARPNGSIATLRKKAYGFIYGDDDLAYRAFPAGTTVTVFASERAKVKRWRDIADAASVFESEIVFHYRVRIDLTETYPVFQPTGDTIQAGRNGGLIPHSALSFARGGREFYKTDWKDGVIAYLIEPHTYTDSNGERVTIPLGEAVMIRSGPHTLTPPHFTTTIPSQAHYAFQRVTESTRNKLWLSCDKIHETYLT